MSPLLTSETCALLTRARASAPTSLECSLDLERTTTRVEVSADHWAWQGFRYRFLEKCKDHTIYYWSGAEFLPAARYGVALVKLVPTAWGAPTFEIDGVKMLPSERVSPYEDARRKVALVEPHGKTVLDCCGGLGYFAAWCLAAGAARIISFERNADVLWLRALNPWSPPTSAALCLTPLDVIQGIRELADRSVDSILHDPPRFSLAGELYSQAFYDQMARVLKPKGRLFHYTGAPNKISRGRDLAAEVIKRLTNAGFAANKDGDGVIAVRGR